MPASETTVPVQRHHPGRSWPSHALIETDRDRRATEDQRAVGDRRARDAAEKQDLVDEVAEDREAGEPPPVGARDTTERGAQALTPRDDSQKERRRDRQADRVEGRPGQLAKGRFHDAEVAAPEERHEEQPGVEP